MVIKRLEDIEREKSKENREKIKREITEDFNEVIDNVFRRPKKKKTFFDYILTLIKILGIFILVLFVLNLFLGNIWLLRFFIKSLFFNL